MFHRCRRCSFFRTKYVSKTSGSACNGRSRMTYIDTLFLVLLIPLVAAVRYVIVPVRLREWLIIAASVMFLATWGHVSLLVFLSVIAINFAATIGIDRAGDRASRYLMAGMIAADLLALGYFKYFNFFIDSWNGVAGTTLP